MYHIEWEVEDLDSLTLKVIDERINNWSKFHGLYHFGRNIMSTIQKKSKLTAKEYATLRCLAPFLL